MFLRREGFPAEDAQDLTQAFFADLIETCAYARADRGKGRFRSFSSYAETFCGGCARSRARAERGGGIIPDQFDEKAIAEIEAQVGRTDKWKADRAYEREWEASLLRQALDRFAQECAVAGKAVSSII